ncbi:MAG: type II toxin-antitoxin system RelE/ParE family toxin [Geobacteraceae bacterium]
MYDPILHVTLPVLTLDSNNTLRYHLSMINSFNCKETEKIFNGKFSSKLPQTIQRLAARKLDYLDSAVDINDLRSPPGNHLETLKEDRIGQHSIRINDQWRICFVWRDNTAYEVEIVDYH